MPQVPVMNFTAGHPLWGDDIIVSITTATDILTLLLNTLPIYTVIRQKRLFPYALDEAVMLFSLTIMATILFTMPLGLVSYLTGSWPGGKTTCVLYQAVVIWCSLMTMCIVTTMGIERIACVKRLLSGDCTFKRHDLRKNRIRLIITLVVSLILSITPAVGLAPSGYATSGKSCQSVLLADIEHTKQYVFYMVFLLIGYFNVVMNVVLYSSIIAQLVTMKKGRQGHMVMDTTLELEQIEVQSQRQEVMVSTVMVVVIALVYYTTTVPALVLVTIQKVSHSAVHTKVVVYSLLVANMSGLLLPVIYPLVSRRYRAQYRRVFSSLCRCRWQSPHSEAIPDMLPSCQLTETPDTETQSDTVLSLPTNSAGHVTPDSSAIAFAKSSCLQNQNYQPVDDSETNSQPICDSVRSSQSNKDSTMTQAINGDIVTPAIVNEDDVLEETTYITHDSEEEPDDDDNDFCMAGSRLNLVSSDEDE